MSAGVRVLLGVTAGVAALAGCGLSLDIDPRPPDPPSMDAAVSGQDGGRDAGPWDAAPAPIDATVDVDASFRECVSNADCASDPCVVSRTCSPAGRCVGGWMLRCDDADYCTVDTCGPTGCEFVVPPVDVCDDRDVCNGVEGCVSAPDAAAACQVTSSVPDCDDRISCTADSCDPLLGCLHVPMDALCPVVTGISGTCDATGDCQYPSLCIPGPGGTCEPAPCQEAHCSGSGSSVACARTDRCMDGEICCGGMCAAPGCDDGDACTADTCGLDGCVHDITSGSPCDDGDPCTVSDTCDAVGACQPGAPRSCDDGNSCTSDSCNATSASCDSTTLADGAPCDDLDGCTTPDACLAGVCRGRARVCPVSDTDPCTRDVCTSTGASTHACMLVPRPEGARCGLRKTCIAGDCTCDSGFTDCDMDGTSCECPEGMCSAGGRCLAVTDPCAATVCPGLLMCCPFDGACFDPACLACCSAVAF